MDGGIGTIGLLKQETQNVLYGTYDIYQPVSLHSSNTQTKSALSTVKGNDIAVNGNNINSLIPIFVLKFIDDAGDRSDAETVLGYVVDVVTTYTGLGSLTKLKHLRWAATGANTVELFSIQGLRLVVGGVEFTSGVLGLFANFVECDPNNSFCNGVKTFIMALQLASLTINATDSLATFAMRRSAGRVIEEAGGANEAEIVQNINDRLIALNTKADPAVVESAANSIYKSGKDVYLFSGIPVKLIELFIKKILNRIKLENRRFFWKADDLTIGISSINYPRFSFKKYVEDGFDLINGREVKKFKNTGDDLHTISDLTEMAEYGKSLGLGEVGTGGISTSVTESLIIKSYRTDKQALKTEVKEWMTNYKTYLTDRNEVLYCFNNATHQEGFFNELKIINKYGFGSDLDHITVAGSSLTKTAPPDLDLFNSAMSKARIKFHLERLNLIFETAVTNKLLTRRELIENIRKSFKTSFAQGKIRPECMLRIENNRLYILKQELKAIPQNLQPITTNKKFDFNIYSSDDLIRSLLPEKKIKLN